MPHTSARLILIRGLPGAGKTTLDVPIEERWRRIEVRNSEASWGAVPITRDQLESWPVFFERPDAAEMETFDTPPETETETETVRVRSGPK